MRSTIPKTVHVSTKPALPLRRADASNSFSTRFTDGVSRRPDVECCVQVAIMGCSALGRLQERTERASDSRIWPHFEQRFEEGKNRSTSTNPAHTMRTCTRAWIGTCRSWRPTGCEPSSDCEPCRARSGPRYREFRSGARGPSSPCASGRPESRRCVPASAPRAGVGAASDRFPWFCG